MTKYTEIDNMVEQAMVVLILDFPIFAQLIARIGVKCVENSQHHALAWTDGTGIYINTPLVNYCNEHPTITLDDGRTINQTINKQNMVFILSHELMHILNLTYDRGVKLGIERYTFNSDKVMAKKFEYWNRATDYEINSLLHNNEIKDADGSYQRKSIGLLPENCLYESEYRNMPAEQIFAKIYKPDEEKEQSGNGTGNNEDDGDNQQGNGSGGGNQYDEDGIPLGEIAVAIDEHMPFLDDTTRNEVINKVGEIIGNCNNGTGFSALDRAIEIAYKPVPFNWRRALAKYIKGWMKDNFTWTKPSRAGLANDLILPSQGRTPKLHMAVAVDTSGSISDNELNKMMQHLFTILQQFKEFKIDVWCCGSKVYDETFRTYNASNKKDIVNFPIVSDGGNDMRENFKFLKEHYAGDKPDVFLILSDFYDPLDGDTETTSICPVVGLVIDHKGFVPPKLMKFTAIPFEVENGKGE